MKIQVQRIDEKEIKVFDAISFKVEKYSEDYVALVINQGYRYVYLLLHSLDWWGVEENDSE